MKKKMGIEEETARAEPMVIKDLRLARIRSYRERRQEKERARLKTVILKFKD